VISPENNDRLTRVERDAPMGRMLRENFWFPFALSEAVVAGAPPERVRLLGENFVTFRAEDGRVALLDEACPHRRASLLLARVEGCALRCIFHGWKIDVSGQVAEVPSEGERAETWGKNVKINHYPVFENGGLLWAWLGNGEPRDRPELPFFDLGPESLWISRTVARCNWFQGIEGTLDSVHVQTLHDSWIRPYAGKSGETIGRSFDHPPRYEIEETTYGLRAAAIRELDDENKYYRVTEYIAPFVALTPGKSDTAASVFIAVPVDDTHHLLFWGHYNRTGPVRHGVNKLAGLAAPGLEYDINNFANIQLDADQRWGQDRQAMSAGHYSGFPRCIVDEDIVVQQSMGPITDRTNERLCSSDVAIVRARWLMLGYLDRFERDETVPHSGMARPIDIVAPSGFDWRSPDALPVPVPA